MFITEDFNHPNKPSIKLSSGLYAGKNINSNLSLNSSKKGNLHAAIERAKEKFECKEIE
ncbi:hypothetical protein UT300003_25820 [Clostridium sardiniense]|nr:hypothetical protein [Clostridium sardiniense]